MILAVLVPLIIFNYFWRWGSGSIRFSSVSIFKKITPTWATIARHTLIFLRAFVILLLIVALARPQSGEELTKIRTEGIDIILALDVSSSMLAEDFTIGGKRYNRLHVVKEAVKDFIKGREDDRIGMVVFAGRAYTQCPLTLDYGVLLQFLRKVEIGMVEDGTAIGSAIGVCVDRLRKTEAKSKVLILLTDGRNNAGEIDPATAAEIAKTFKIKIYTIGAGTRGPVPFPAEDMFGNKILVSRKIDIDDDTLTQIATTTGGQYFRATDTNSLKEIYKQIDALEKTKTEVTKYTEYSELFKYLVIPALGLILFEIILANTRFRKIP
ncbi:MAG: vWA domain-containing protein [Candidatus Brocadiales bacterium]